MTEMKHLFHWRLCITFCACTVVGTLIAFIYFDAVFSGRYHSRVQLNGDENNNTHEHNNQRDSFRKLAQRYSKIRPGSKAEVSENTEPLVAAMDDVHTVSRDSEYYQHSTSTRPAHIYHFRTLKRNFPVHRKTLRRRISKPKSDSGEGVSSVIRDEALITKPTALVNVKSHSPVVRHATNMQLSHKRLPHVRSNADDRHKSKNSLSAKILVLSPISNVASVLPHYFELVSNFSYPHELISIVLGEDSSSDDTYEKALILASQYQSTFRRVKVIQFEQQLAKVNTWEWIHAYENQYKRRSHLAKARNQLLSHSLNDEDWVLWIDCDVQHIPSDIIQTLLRAQKDIVAPGCYYMQADGRMSDYDRNSWQETKRSLQSLDQRPENFLKMEGYQPSDRLLMSDLRAQGSLVPLDGVGGCVLLIRAQCHHEGLTFPPFVFDHHIETEGLAKMAKRMGYEVYGMPYIEVIHM